MKSLLIDGDGIVYRCGFAVEKTKYLQVTGGNETEGTCLFFDSAKQMKDCGWDSKDAWSRKEIEPVEYALKLVDTVITKIKNRYPEHGKDCKIILSPSVGNFRDKIATRDKYKGNRDTSQRPKYFNEITSYLMDERSTAFVCTRAVGCEADDTISYHAWYWFKLYNNYDNYVIVSLDKDLDQIPGVHYNWVKEEEYVIDPKEACINLYSQILAGDPTDNIRGIEGIGPQKARKMLEACTSSRDCWETVRNAYRDKYGAIGEEHALETGRLVGLMRKEGEIWEPPTL